MIEDSVSRDYLIGLYNGRQAIAERVEPTMLRHIHVKTELDRNIGKWLESGRDIVLTGNPGDGKTHLLSYLDLPDDVCVEKDASQKKVGDILQTWSDRRRSGQQYILAINHAPLRQLAEVASNKPEVRELHEMLLPTKRNQSAIDNFVVYSDEQEQQFSEDPPSILIVDLSQREILTDEIVDALLTDFALWLPRTPVPSSKVTNVDVAPCMTMQRY